jgi:hypothetical protein
MKIRIKVCITAAALLILTGASVWEGAASIAPGGDLPDEGYYAATNSFPRNTVVDITNLETGKSIRVIVAAGLDTPGLLAVLSREAAGAIGLRPRAIGRIRLTQPSDPVAFSQFTEGRASNGDPDYDPRALMAADPAAAALLQEPDTGRESPAVPPAGLSGETAAPVQAAEPEPGYDEIVDIPDSYNPPAALGKDEGISREPDAAWVYEPEELAGERGEPADTPAEYPPPGGIAEAEERPEEWKLTEAEEAPGAVELPDPLETAAAGEDEGVPEPEHPEGTAYDYTLVPAEERPPEDYPEYTLPPDAEISSIPERRDGTGGPDESFFVAPIGEAAAAPDYSGEPGVPAAPSLFSVPLIGSLERGKYYVQLGAFNRPESAESELNKIEKTYPLSIQNGGSEEQPVYRILVGPINLGESGALLQRFKSIGYHDAFVRSGS